MNIPVYLISGFLESGKTSFISETLKDENFSTGEKTLVIITEEGLEELDSKLLQKTNGNLVLVEDEKDFTKDFVLDCTKKYRPDRVLIECNGMWDMDTFYKNIVKPWMIVQIITVINGKTFSNYYNNMRQIIISHFLNANMVIINRCNKDMELSKYRRMIKGSNTQTEIYFEDEEGYMMEIKGELLPFDINDELIEISDDDYGLWYLDIKENPEKYINKKIKVRGIYNKPKNYPRGGFLHGRHAMTCCEEDISFIGIVCIANEEIDIKNGEWITITAKVECRENKELGEIMDILLVEKIEKATTPDNKLVTFS